MASTQAERLLTDDEIVAVSSTVDSKGFLTAMCAAQDAKSYAAGQEAERAKYEALVAKVRRRVIVDFYAGASLEAVHYGTCRLCSWTWMYGSTERHEPGCPMEEKP